MEMEELEKLIADRQRVLSTLGIDWSAYEAFKDEAANGLLKFGDSFSQTLGTALAIADLKDSIKIIRYWHQECEQHALLYKLYVAKLKGEGNEHST